ncbi:unnamed protein product [Dicrocoelium dendriticum]|nr:unnamed protein product [Dicrocoelium dendriticum]
MSDPVQIETTRHTNTPAWPLLSSNSEEFPRLTPQSIQPISTIQNAYIELSPSAETNANIDFDPPPDLPTDTVNPRSHEVESDYTSYKSAPSSSSSDPTSLTRMSASQLPIHLVPYVTENPYQKCLYLRFQQS